MNDARAREVSWLVAVPPGLLTFGVCLIGIGSSDLWVDEYATWHASTIPLDSLFRLLDHVDALLGPYYLAMHAWLSIVGDEPASIRLPSAVAMGCAAGLLALVGRRLFDPWTGLGAGLMIAAVPMVSLYGQEARPYSIAIAGVILATLLLLRAIDVPSWRRWTWYACGVALVGLVHVVALTVLLAHAVLVWHDARSTHAPVLRRWLVAVTVPIGALLPLVVKGSTQMASIGWIEADGDAVRALPSKLFASTDVALIVIALGSAGAAAWWRRERRPVVLLLSWAVLPVVFCLVTFPLLHVFLARYLLFTVPAWILLAAALPRALMRRTGDRGLAMLVGLAILAVVGVAGLPRQDEVRRYPRWEPDYGAAARAVQSDARDADGIVFTGTRRDARLAFAYLDAVGTVDLPKDVLLDSSAEESGSFRATECRDTARCLDGTDRIWVVLAADPGASPGGNALRGLSRRAQAALRAEFDVEPVMKGPHVRVLLLERAD